MMGKGECAMQKNIPCPWEGNKEMTCVKGWGTVGTCSFFKEMKGGYCG